MQQAEASRQLATAILESIHRGTPAEPNWWSTAVELAHKFRTSEQYQVWLAVREILIVVAEKCVPR